jgi:hypothetical protein
VDSSKELLEKVINLISFGLIICRIEGDEVLFVESNLCADLLLRKDLSSLRDIGLGEIFVSSTIPALSLFIINECHNKKTMANLSAISFEGKREVQGRAFYLDKDHVVLQLSTNSGPCSNLGCSLGICMKANCPDRSAGTERVLLYSLAIQTTEALEVAKNVEKAITTKVEKK